MAGGQGDLARMHGKRLDETMLRLFRCRDAWAELVDCLQQEKEWMSKHSECTTRWVIQREPLPDELKRLRKHTFSTLRRCTREEREMLKLVSKRPVSWPGPRQDSIQYRAATKLIPILASIPSVTGIALFGSTSRGTNREDSDVDLIITAGQMRKVRDLYHDIRTLLNAEDRGIDGTMLVPARTLDVERDLPVQFVISHG